MPGASIEGIFQLLCKTRGFGHASFDLPAASNGAFYEGDDIA
jgi:hypothetical protein